MNAKILEALGNDCLTTTQIAERTGEEAAKVSRYVAKLAGRGVLVVNGTELARHSRRQQKKYCRPELAQPATPKAPKIVPKQTWFSACIQ